VPGLYDTITPESLALHEAIADLTALVMAISSDELRKTLLSQTNDSISGRNAFTSIAEEFGKARGGANGDPYLRTLDNKLRMNDVDSTNAHQLSQVLSGALFSLLSSVFEDRKEKSNNNNINSEFSGKSLFVASSIFRRLAFRALDYLPPGEISFADYGRAMWAADRSSNPDSPEYREALAEQFVDRNIIDNVDQLDTDVPEPEALAGLDLDALVDSDWLAYDFANRHRELLLIPSNVQNFQILPRLRVNKVTYRSGHGEFRYSEILFKVQWETTEDNPVDGLAARRGISFGTTLAINPDSGAVAGRVTTNPAITGVDQADDRTRLIAKLLDDDLIGTHAPAQSGVPTVTTSSDVMRVRGIGRTLHMTSANGFQLSVKEP